MSGPLAPTMSNEAIEQYIARIEAHLARLAQGHDPIGHLFGIERLARCARAEWLTTKRRGESGRNKT
jgi:hypothetical protein